MVLFVLFLLNMIEYAYARLGISESALFALVIASLVGGAINIPIARMRGAATSTEKEVSVFGVRYRVPVTQHETTILALNVGGAIIPTGVSILLMVRSGLWWEGAVCVAFVAFFVHLAARPVPGLGIAVPALMPPLLAAAAALTVAPHTAAAVAYVAGTLGTLIGGDLLNVGRMSEVGAGVVSIGGAGTFDGVFLSGIMAVLLVGLAL